MDVTVTLLGKPAAEVCYGMLCHEQGVCRDVM